MFGRRQKGGAAVGVCLDAEMISVAAITQGANERPRLNFAACSAAADDLSPDAHLETLLRQGNLQGRRGHLVLPLGNYQTMQLDLSDVPLDEARQAARWQIGERIDYPPEQAVIDLYQIAPFAGERRTQNYAVVARRQSLREQVDKVGTAGSHVVSIDIPEFALRNICELFVDDLRGVALLLLLDQSGLFVVVRDGVLYLSRQLPMGMDRLLAYQADDPDMMELFDTIVLDIQRSFDFCESNFQLPLVSRLLVAQTRQELPALVKYLDDYLATSVEPLRLDAVMDIEPVVEPLDLNRQLLSIGAALRQEES